MFTRKYVDFNNTKQTKVVKKPILCLDFDGVIHSYRSGWQGADVIPDGPVDGAMLFIDRAREKFKIAIFSSRSHQQNGLKAMQLWMQLQLHRYTEGDEAAADMIYADIEWPTNKPPAFLTIDDRAVTFTGVWPTIEDLAKFKPFRLE